jgi:hypothetical protein
VPKEIIVPDAPFSSTSILLSGISVVISFYWNEPFRFWSMSISFQDVPIIEGFAIMTNSCVSYSWGYKLQAINEDFGAIYCMNTDLSDDPVERFSFGKTALLLYYSAEELLAESIA